MQSKSPTPLAIEVQGLTKSYRVYSKREGLRAAVAGLFRRQYQEVVAVDGVELRVEPGEFVAFLGPNGAGKTTTLKLLSGIIYPSSGTARVMGYVPWERDNAYRRRFALVMGQKNQLWWDLPAQESYRLHQRIYRIEPDVYQRRVDELSQLLEVRRLLGRPVRELSLGERMKMELIAALLHAPDVLFLDEPTIGLDVVAQHSVQQFLKYYQQERKITILLTSHYMKDIVALCQRVVVIADGRVQHDGSLTGIVDSFSGRKIITLLLSEGVSADGLERFGELLSVELPRVRLECPRQEVPQLLASILSQVAVDDVAVEDPPLEDTIAQLYRRLERPGRGEVAAGSAAATAQAVAGGTDSGASGSGGAARGERHGGSSRSRP